jgi:myo-inositol-1(or 4)-monophosphatase
MAAGALLITEAGGLISDLDSKDTYLKSGDVVAANPEIHDEMLNNLNLEQ